MESTDHAVGRLHRLGLAVQLVAEALDVVEPVGDDDVVARQHALDGRIFFRARILLGLCGVIDTPGDAEGLVVDEVDSEAADACIGAGTGDLGLAKIFKLSRARRLPRGGVSFDGD